MIENSPNFFSKNFQDAFSNFKNKKKKGPKKNLAYSDVSSRQMKSDDASDGIR
jgi:hypothetical protein